MAELPIVINATRAKKGGTEVVKVLVDIKAHARQTTNEVERTTKKLGFFGRIAKSVGSSFVSFFAAFAGIAAIRQSLKLLAEFEETMLTIRAVMGGVASVSEDTFNRITEAAREAGATTRFTAVQAGEALLALARAGFDAEESIAALQSTLNLAVVGNLQLGEAADIVANSIRQFTLAASEADRVADVLTVTSNKSNTNVQQLGEAFKFAGPVAAAAGLEMEETAAALGVLANAGIKASLAGTNLRGTIAALLGPTGGARDRLKEMGLTLDEVSPATNRFSVVMARLKDAGLTASDAVEIFGRRNAAAALVLTGNIDQLEKLTAATQTQDNAAKKAANLIDTSLKGKYKAFISAIQELVLSLGDSGLTSALKGVLEFFTNLFRAMSGNTDEITGATEAFIVLADVVKIVTVTIAALLALKLVIVLGAWIAGLGGLGAAFTALTAIIAANPIGAFVVALTTAAAIIGTLIGRTNELTAAQKRQLKLIRELNLQEKASFGAQSEFARAAKNKDALGQIKALREQIALIDTIKSKLVRTGRKTVDTGSLRPISNLGTVFGNFGDKDNEVSFERKREAFFAASTGFRDNNGIKERVFSVELLADAYDKEIDRLKKLEGALRQDKAARDAAQRLEIEMAAGRTQAIASVAKMINAVRLETSLIGESNETKARTMALIKAEQALIKGQVAGRDRILSQLEAEIKHRDKLIAQQQQWEQLNDFATSIANETALLQLKGEERAILEAIIDAERIAAATGIALTNAQRDAIIDLVKEREGVKRAIEAEAEAARAADREKKKQEREAKALGKGGPRGFTFQSSASAIATTSRFTGVAEGFRSQTQVIRDVEKHTRAMEKHLRQMNERARRARTNNPAANVNVPGGTR